MIYMIKNKNLRAEVEELVRENKKLSAAQDGLNQRLHSLRQVNKQQERKLEKTDLNFTQFTATTVAKQPKSSVLEHENTQRLTALLDPTTSRDGEKDISLNKILHNHINKHFQTVIDPLL